MFYKKLRFLVTVNSIDLLNWSSCPFLTWTFIEWTVSQSQSNIYNIIFNTCIQSEWGIAFFWTNFRTILGSIREGDFETTVMENNTPIYRFLGGFFVLDGYLILNPVLHSVTFLFTQRRINILLWSIMLSFCQPNFWTGHWPSLPLVLETSKKFHAFSW